MLIRQLFDADTGTYTYIVADTVSKTAALIDPVLGQEQRDTRVVRQLGMTLAWVIETHIHADHITAASVLRDKTGCQIIVPAVNAAPNADRTLQQGDIVRLGDRHLTALSTPGHTEGSMSYVLDDATAVFTGDALMIRSCGRTDFQGGSAETLYHSVHNQLYTLPDACIVHPGHDYTGQTASSIGEEKLYNRRIALHIDEAAFVRKMSALNLPPPRQLHIAVPANKQLGATGHPITWVQRGGLGARQADVAWMLGAGADIRRIDVREVDEYTGPLGHVPDTELVPLATLADAAIGWKQDQPLLIICRSGKRSERGALVLEEMGFTHVACLEGGTMAFNKQAADSGQPSGGCA
jgi:sulfur dioxygenase